ncbi:MAG: alpha/beta hydrolase-fold protein [Verrucomicrobiota bacterium]
MKSLRLLPFLLVSLATPEQALPQLASEPSRRQSQPGPENRNDAYYRLGPDSLPLDGVPKGKYSEARVIQSNVYPGTQHTYWVYVPAQYNPAQPVAVMVFNDGQAFMKDTGDVRVHHVLDNLIYRREIPVMLGVFINPGRRPDQPEPPEPGGGWGDRTTNRPEEYNSIHDKYARVIVEELMPALRREYNLSPDPEMHGIGGASSGAIAAFTVAWHRSDQFRKVFSFVGSFVNLGNRQGHTLSDLVAQQDKKPFRIFLQDGRNDNRGRAESSTDRDWFFNNVKLADALIKKGYDVNYTWGIGNHGQKQGGAIFPEIMRWLWRDATAVSTDRNDLVERSFRAPVAELVHPRAGSLGSAPKP